MKTIKPVLLVLLIIAIVSTVARVVIIRHRQNELAAAERAASQKAARAAELERLSQPPPKPQPAPEPVAVPPPAVEAPPATEPPNVNRPVAPAAPPPAAPPVTPGGNREVRQDPLARVALSLVGVDPYAEAYWLEAIYDTNLSDREREDLMEDLNEEGLSNPRQPAPEDFPLIANRLRILEDLIPNVSDPFMLEHIGEAYKDLLLLYAGEPAR
jgi:type II secretory pathway pseudopilin PulG